MDGDFYLGFLPPGGFPNTLVIVPPVGRESLAKLCWLWSGSVRPCTPMQ